MHPDTWGKTAQPVTAKEDPKVAKARAKAQKKMASLDKMVEKSSKLHSNDLSTRTRNMLKGMDKEIGDL